MLLKSSISSIFSQSGIGAIKAEAIMEYRITNCFDSIQELSEVKGIGVKTIEKIETT